MTSHPSARGSVDAGVQMHRGKLHRGKLHRGKLHRGKRRRSRTGRMCEFGEMRSG
ncbi:MAG: hypothetical protein ABSG93_08645 [Solirubrobacteraceae bacterium]